VVVAQLNKLNCETSHYIALKKYLFIEARCSQRAFFVLKFLINTNIYQLWKRSEKLS
jgi:hypothetical protein